MSDYTDIYKNLLIKQYWDKANAVAEVELRAGAYERVYQILRDFETAFDLDTATGDRLDKIGKIVGISREDLEPYFDLFFGFDDNELSLPMGFKFATYLISIIPTTYNPLDQYGMAFSNGDLTLQDSGASEWHWAKTPINISSGKWYCEIYINYKHPSGHICLGIGDSDDSSFPGHDDGYGLHSYLKYYHNNTYSGPPGSYFTTGDTIGIALDLDNGKIWWSKNGVWLDGGNPEAGLSPAYSSINTIPWYIFTAHYNGSNRTTTNFGATAFTYAPPTGFRSGVYTEVHSATPDYTAGKFFDKFYTNTIPGVLTDDEYRFYIKAKIAINSAAGYMVSDNYISIQDVIQYLFDGYAIVFDDMVMSLTLEVEDSIPRGRVFLARDLNLLPRPQGVEYNTIALASYDYFGWDDDPNAGGWGTWSDASIGGVFATYL